MSLGRGIGRCAWHYEQNFAGLKKKKMTRPAKKDPHGISASMKFMRKIAKLQWVEIRDLPIIQLDGLRWEARSILDKFRKARRIRNKFKKGKNE